MIVDLYVYASHEVTVWENIWRALKRRGVDVQYVVEPPGTNRARGTASEARTNWHDDKTDGTVVDLMDDLMFERTLSLLADLGIPWISSSRTNADVAVTTAGSGWLAHYRGKLVRTMYGVGAVTDSYGHGSINDAMDAVLVHGPFSRHSIAAHNRRAALFEIGFPKWTVAFENGFDKMRARHELGLVDDGRPVVAWLPTWAQNSSIDRFGSSLANLSGEYRVIAKPHHNNLRFEQQRIDGIDHHIEIMEDLPSLVPLVTAADIVVGDARSGGVTEALLADRPVVGLIPTGDRSEQRLLVGIEEAIAFCERGEDLPAALELAADPTRHEARTRWATWFFGEVRDDGSLAADAIIGVGRAERGKLSLEIDADEVDRHLEDHRHGRSAVSSAQLFTLLWQSWPGDPRLVDLLDGVHTRETIGALLACGREVRLHGRLEHCPVHRLASDETQGADRRLGAAAVGSVEFDDQRCTNLFLDLCSTLDEDDLEPCLVMLLTVEPSVVPAYIAGVSEAGHREAVVALLQSVGASADELDVLLATA